MIAVDDFRFVADWLFLGTAGLTVLVSFEYLEREALLVPEYFALLLFATLGMMLDRKSTRLNSSHLVISYAVFCLKKKKKNKYRRHTAVQPLPCSVQLA